MMIIVSVRVKERISGKFLPVDRYIVSSGLLCGQSKRTHSFYDYLKLAAYIYILFSHTEGKIQIAQVMVDSSTAGEAADQVAAVCFQF